MTHLAHDELPMTVCQYDLPMMTSARNYIDFAHNDFLMMKSARHAR
jgi:hypothetical protein